jgi:hypothetical protein
MSGNGLLAWQRALAAAATVSAANVPEPRAAMLAIWAAAVLGTVRRRAFI